MAVLSLSLSLCLSLLFGCCLFIISFRHCFIFYLGYLPTIHSFLPSFILSFSSSALISDTNIGNNPQFSPFSTSSEFDIKSTSISAKSLISRFYFGRFYLLEKLFLEGRFLERPLSADISGILNLSLLRPCCVFFSFSFSLFFSSFFLSFFF